MEEQFINSTEVFEQLLAKQSQEFYFFRLYIAGTTLQSIRAVENIKIICEEYLQGRYKLEIIDVYQQPELAKPENILAVPTLVKALPPPLQKIIGDLSNHSKVIVGLNILKKELIKVLKDNTDRNLMFLSMFN